MMGTKSGLAVALCAAAVLVAGCSSSPVEHSDASWAEHYNTVADMTAHSALVVQGTIKDNSGRHKESSVQIADSTVAITKVLSDPRHLVTDATGKLISPTVVVGQTAGTGGQTQEISDDPIFKKNEQVVLFLRVVSPGHYAVVGGPNGRLTVSNGAIKPFNAESVPFTGNANDLAAAVTQK